MPSYFRSPKPKALAATLKALDYLPASQVVQIVERYEREVWLTEVAKNPRIVALAALEVGGKGVPWSWGTAPGPRRTTPTSGGRTQPKLYLQSVDRYRAQALLDDPEAKWEIYMIGGDPRREQRTQAPYVRRVR